METQILTSKVKAVNKKFHSNSVVPSSLFQEAVVRLCEGRVADFPSEDPEPSNLSQSPSRSADAAEACGTASAAGLTHKHTQIVLLSVPDNT